VYVGRFPVCRHAAQFPYHRYRSRYHPTLTRCDLALTNGLNGLVKLVVGQSQPALESKLRTLFRLTRKRAPGPFRFHSRKLRGATLMKAVIPSCRRLIESAVAVVVAKLAARLGRPR
jgi:hypothetical protein